MRPYLADAKFLDQQEVSTQYDLFGIIYHFGSLSYGHYLSVVKNPFSKKWFKYDD
jgi:ubiquitin C-terminal hydrolase